MDIDGDLQSDRATIKDLIGVNNGVIDAEVGDDGSKTGQITSNTRYLVMGNRPTDKSAAEVMTNITKMIDEAKQYGVRDDLRGGAYQPNGLQVGRPSCAAWHAWPPGRFPGPLSQ